MEKTYNGWTNWETWNFYLWHGDELQETISEYKEETEQTLEHGQVYHMIEGYIDNILEEQELSNMDGFMRDTISHGFQMVNINEIADKIQK